MRVPDFVLKTVAFISEIIDSGATGDDYDAQGTGFFAMLPADGDPNRFHHYFITAKHVILGLKRKRFALVINERHGKVRPVEVTYEKWCFHPSDASVDAAAMPFEPRQELESLSFQSKYFVTPESMKPAFGVGDDIFIPGLFTYAQGRARNMPIIRHGNLAMIPDEEIQVNYGFAKFANVYLIEARSIGGISGSPVLIRKTVSLPTRNFDTSETRLHGLSAEFHVLGLVQGHWDIKESEINNPGPVQDKQRGVNMGIAVVVPAHKILEILNGPELTELRRAADEEFSRAVSPGLD